MRDASVGDDLLTLAETAALLRLSEATVYKMCRSGAIPARKIGRQWRILRSDFQSLLAGESQEHPSPRPGAGAEPIDDFRKEGQRG
jgi:excisionase family DNA binding protein